MIFRQQNKSNNEKKMGHDVVKQIVSCYRGESYGQKVRCSHIKEILNLGIVLYPHTVSSKIEI